jgi:hypothetical protein
LAASEYMKIKTEAKACQNNVKNQTVNNIISSAEEKLGLTKMSINRATVLS